MRRAALGVLTLPAGYRGGTSTSSPGARPAERLLALLVVGAAIVAGAVTVMTTAGPIAGEHASRTAASAQLPAAAWGPVSRALGRDDLAYRAAQAGPGFVAHNPRQLLQAHFSPAGVMVHAGAVLLGMRLRAYGHGDTLQGLGAVAPTARANRVVYRHGSLSEWYVNGPLGLEQGFTLTARTARGRAGPLTLALGLSGTARAILSHDSEGVTFWHGASTLSYRGLIATDARGRTLPAWLEVHGRQLLLRVRDAGAQYPLLIDPFIQKAKLTASDGGAFDFLGNSVAVSGDTIVAGAEQVTVNGSFSQGAVYVFVKPESGWANASETAKLTASDGAAGDFFGGAVALSGDTVVAGAPVFSNGRPGAVYVFVKPTGGWRSETETAKLTASDGAAGNFFGGAVAIKGDIVLAGAPGAMIDGNAAQGAVYVFLKPTGGWRNETETAKLTASDGAAGDNLGVSVAISGDTVVAGAFATVNGNPLQGATYVFLKRTGGWRSETEAAKLTASDGAAFDFCCSVAVSGNTVVAGASQATVNGSFSQGAVYVFVMPMGGWRSETEIAKLTASDDPGGVGLGSSVAIQGDTVVAGAPGFTVNTLPGFFLQGAAYVFVKPAGGWRSETEAATLIGSDLKTVGFLGNAVAVSGDRIVAGAPLTTVGNHRAQGAVYVFEGRARDFQSTAVIHSAARDTLPRAVLRRPHRCTPFVAHRAALAPLLRWLRPRERPRC